ncbi:Os06g0611350 [Oryza sativa Japonica Group]|uniref:Os06g0611350 protein n=1 Tax=Oryza sativa subsp. japonica TaxID=39947 RepID=A0A0P0WZ33_ORYSJ|nr:Os06g0611350 [Oryza sativa Japonica Group]
MMNACCLCLTDGTEVKSRMPGGVSCQEATWGSNSGSDSDHIFRSEPPFRRHVLHTCLLTHLGEATAACRRRSDAHDAPARHFEAGLVLRGVGNVRGS